MFLTQTKASRDGHNCVPSHTGSIASLYSWSSDCQFGGTAPSGPGVG